MYETAAENPWIKRELSLVDLLKYSVRKNIHKAINWDQYRKGHKTSADLSAPIVAEIAVTLF